jgi:hypothetical protein
MEINLNLRQLALGAAAIGLIVLLAVVGHAVTPVAEGSRSWPPPRLVLTPERWEAAALARKAGAEIVRLEVDGRALATLAAAEPPDAVQAMLLAQRIYAGQRSGTAATATARAALVDAAAAVARYAGGGLTRQAAIEAVNAALARIRALRGRAVSRIPTDEQDRHVAFLPLASVGFAGRESDSLRARREADR